MEAYQILLKDRAPQGLHEEQRNSQLVSKNLMTIGM